MGGLGGRACWGEGWMYGNMLERKSGDGEDGWFAGVG